MKKYALVPGIAAVAVFVMLSACAKGYESQKAVDDLKVRLSIERYPLVKGDNALSISVIDAAGRSITDATVNAHYYMPPMPGMAPMDYSTQAVVKGGGYAFSANIPMEGGWKVEVSVARTGRPAITATFNVDAR